ncbi:MAG: hypothetical protein CSA05_00630 [Bacteroidia bacterium]|nr:MAG: hypothetical protein CSB01_00385 [Bacteroidia bacterium]PIE86402.1 MAG: hypothetical protein CSA05_00630 [Bacteroidia bacterium]
MRPNKIILIILIFGLVLPLLSCSQEKEYPEKYSLYDFFLDNAQLAAKIDSIYERMSDNERIAQMIVTAGGKLGKDNAVVERLIENKQVGGVLLLKGQQEKMKELIQNFSDKAKEVGSLPLMFSCDAEPTLLNSKIKGTPLVPYTYRISDYDVAGAVAVQIARIVKDLGFHMNFAPVCDFSINKNVMKNRSFGKDTETVGLLSEAFILGTQKNNIVATAKHFPGHGTVKNDSHKGIVFINGEIPELEVFRRAVDVGVIAVMVGHIAVKNNEKFSTDGLPATLSKRIVSDLLKDSLDFKGIVVTDAMNMGAVQQYENAELNAVIAGCDLILFPKNEALLIQNIKKRIEQFEPFRKKIEISVKKIIRLKICLGLLDDYFLEQQQSP